MGHPNPNFCFAYVLFGALTIAAAPERAAEIAAHLRASVTSS